jgi:translation initiation factor 3 subunit J
MPPPPTIAREQPKGQWDDEDIGEDEDVKESWEDEEKPAPVCTLF